MFLSSSKFRGVLQVSCVVKILCDEEQAVRAWMGIFLLSNVMKIPPSPCSVLQYAFVCILLSGNFFLILVQLGIPVESDQSFSEQGSPGNTSHSTALSTDASLQEEKAEDTESSSVTVRAQEPSAATGSDFSYLMLMHFLKQMTPGVLNLYKC